MVLISMMPWTTLECHYLIFLRLVFDFLKFLKQQSILVTKWFTVATLNFMVNNHSQFSYVIDGGDQCHITQWTPRQDNGMFPILVPNTGFKKFAEIKPNEGIQFKNRISGTQILFTSLAPSSHWVWQYWIFNMKREPEIATIFEPQILHFWCWWQNHKDITIN